MVKSMDLNNFKSLPGEIYIHKDSDIAEDIEIGFGTIIYNDVAIEDGCKLFEHCIIRPEVKIGKNSIIHDSVEIGYQHKEGMKTIFGDNCLIRRGSTIYAGSTFGKHFQTGGMVDIREKCIFGDYCSVGTLSQFQGYTNVGNNSRFHSNVHVAQYSTIGNYNWIFMYTVFTNDKYPPYGVCPPNNRMKGPITEDFVIVSTGCLLMPGIIIGTGSMAGAGSVITKDIPEGELWMGVPAVFVKKMDALTWNDEFTKIMGIKNPYPWWKYLKREDYKIDK